MTYLDKPLINKPRDFTLKEIHTNDILKPVNPSTLVDAIINPFTNEIYDGLILSGCFAEMDVVNNNSRFYTEENYLPFIEDLKKDWWSEGEKRAKLHLILQMQMIYHIN